MFISQLQQDGSEQEHASPVARLSGSKQPAQLHPVPKHTNRFQKDCAYRFEAISHLLCVCKRLRNDASVCESSAYRDENGAYFLFLTVLSATPFTTPEELGFITEYGTVENASLLRLYIREHATLISTPDAVRQLSVLG